MTDADNKSKLIEELTLVLLYLTSSCTESPDTHEKVYAAWKSYDWNAMDKLIENGFVQTPKCRRTHARILTENGVMKAKELLKHLKI